MRDRERLEWDRVVGGTNSEGPLLVGELPSNLLTLPTRGTTMLVGDKVLCEMDLEKN